MDGSSFAGTNCTFRSVNPSRKAFSQNTLITTSNRPLPVAEILDRNHSVVVATQNLVPYKTLTNSKFSVAAAGPGLAPTGNDFQVTLLSLNPTKVNFHCDSGTEEKIKDVTQFLSKSSFQVHDEQLFFFEMFGFHV